MLDAVPAGNGKGRDAAAGTEQVDEGRVKLTLSLSADDKVKLKYAAAKRNMTVAKLVHEWIETLD